MHTQWVVYAKPCISHTPSIVTYLARYSHRIAISNRRILGLEDEQVVFRYKDYRDDGRHKVMRLPGAEFIRRFLLHVLPKGLMRLRHYGFLANRCREKKLQRIRDALECGSENTTVPKETDSANAFEHYPCPKCHQGMLRVFALLPPERWTEY